LGRKENLNKAKEIYNDVMNEICKDRNNWKDFLEFSSRFYKYSFTENLLMFGQNKNVSMCATLEEWNSIGRWIKPHSSGIKILRDTEDNMHLDYVFDVNDTYARKDIPNAYTDKKLENFKWNATKEQATEILKNYFGYEDIDSLENTISTYISKEIDNSGLLLNLSEKEENECFKPEFIELLVKSTTYQVACRCGIKEENVDKLLNGYEKISNPIVINVLGNCISHCSSELLKIIEYKIKQIKKEELKYANTRKIWNNNQEESKGDVSNKVQRINDTNNINGQIIGERTGDIKTEGDNRETIEGTEPTSNDRGVYSGSEIQSGNRTEDRGTITTNVGGENLKDDKEVEQSTSFSLPKYEVPEDLVNRVLSDGGNTEDSINRIKDILTNDEMTTKEQIIAIRNEYGDAGASVEDFSWESRAKGLTIEDKVSKAKITLGWADVLKRMKNIFKVEDEQLGFESLVSLSYQENEIIEKEDNSKYDFIKDLLGKDITLSDREYQVNKVNLETKEIELYDKSIKGWFPILRLMNLDEFALEYSKSNSIKQDEEEIIDNKINYEMPIESEKLNARQRANANIEAIKLLKQIESENRFATVDEQSVLAKYSGWGGLSKVFDSHFGDWQVQPIEVENNLTEEEYAEAKASVVNSFYTDPIIIDSMYMALDRFGFKGGNILEPSARNR